MFPIVSSQRRLMRSAVNGHQNHGAAWGQPGVQRVPAPPAVGAGDADVLIDARKRHTVRQQLLALGFRVPARQVGDSGGWCRGSRRSRASLASSWSGLHHTYATHTQAS